MSGGQAMVDLAQKPAGTERTQQNSLNSLVSLDQVITLHHVAVHAAARVP